MSALPTDLHYALESAGLRPLDVALADWGYRHGGDRAGALGLALASHAVGQGHTGLLLDDDATRPNGADPLMDPAEFREALAENPLVMAYHESPQSDATRRPSPQPSPGGRGSCPLSLRERAGVRARSEAARAAAQPPARPLVLDAGRLYLHRYWDYEQRLANRLRTLLAVPPEPIETAPLEPDGGLFSYAWTEPGETNWQAVAAWIAQRHRFAVISGGPGTGKTYIVVRLLVRQIESALAAGQRPPVIHLAAPTGKAAARMMASIQQGLDELKPTEEIREHLPRTASTLHRLLRLRWGSTEPGHDRENPLAADAVIVDEASMVDLPLMAKLADAIPDGARLILLGDRYQLSSVESGAVLADLCAPAGVNAFSDEQRAAAGTLLADAPTAKAPSTLADHVVTLQTSHRFRADSAIGRLAAAINAGDPEAVKVSLDAGNDEIRTIATADETAIDLIVRELADAYGVLNQSLDPADALSALENLRLLTATRIGAYGSEALNRRIATRLAERHGFDPNAAYYHGRPIIVTRNDPRVGLYNGDVGIIQHNTEGRIRAWFQTPDGLRALQPSALPPHTTVYAMTIHKAQGSEFETVYLLPAPTDSPVLTRELLYTGVTRAKQHLILAAASTAPALAIDRRAERVSGLAERIAQ